MNFVYSSTMKQCILSTDWAGENADCTRTRQHQNVVFRKKEKYIVIRHDTIDRWQLSRMRRHNLLICWISETFSQVPALVAFDWRVITQTFDTGKQLHVDSSWKGNSRKMVPQSAVVLRSAVQRAFVPFFKGIVEHVQAFDVQLDMLIILGLQLSKRDYFSSVYFLLLFFFFVVDRTRLGKRWCTYKPKTRLEILCGDTCWGQQGRRHRHKPRVNLAWFPHRIPISRATYFIRPLSSSSRGYTNHPQLQLNYFSWSSLVSLVTDVAGGYSQSPQNRVAQNERNE